MTLRVCEDVESFEATTAIEVNSPARPCPVPSSMPMMRPLDWECHSASRSPTLAAGDVSPSSADPGSAITSGVRAVRPAGGRTIQRMQARKLGLKPGQRVSLDEPPGGWHLADPPDGLATPARLAPRT